jgi:endogenous inhibitor of DNA gyrase (YacG/DUF329 family)
VGLDPARNFRPSIHVQIPMSDSNSSPVVREREVLCPRCGETCVYGASNPSRPFCSPRCRNADFGAWATESYRIAKPVGEPEGEDDGEIDLPPGGVSH